VEADPVDDDPTPLADQAQADQQQPVAMTAHRTPDPADRDGGEPVEPVPLTRPAEGVPPVVTGLAELRAAAASLKNLSN